MSFGEEPRRDRAPLTLKYYLPGDPVFDQTDDDALASIFGRGKLVVLYGEPSTGKSAFVAHLLARAGAGAEFFGREMEPGSSIFVAGERGDLTSRRLIAEAREVGSRPATGIVLSKPGAYDDRELIERVSNAAADLLDDTGLKVRFIVFDTLATCYPGLDENSSRIMGPILEAMQQIAISADATVIVIHHGSKNGGGERGSTAIRAKADVVLRTHRRKDGFSVVVDKRNDGPEGQRFVFDIIGSPDGSAGLVVPKLAADEAAEAAASPEAGSRHSAKSEALLDLLDEAGGEIAKLDALERLRSDGVLTGSTEATRKAFSRLVETMVKAGDLAADAGTLRTLA